MFGNVRGLHILADAEKIKRNPTLLKEFKKNPDEYVSNLTVDMSFIVNYE